MRVKPIYQPKGAAREYGELALNIYTGCPHRCYYCFAPNVLHRIRDTFHNEVKPRENIVEETHKQLEREHITDKRIHLCFTCDPYPVGHDTTVTREIIKMLKEHGNSVQILTYRISDYSDTVQSFGLFSFDKGNPLLGRDVFQKLEELVKTHHRVEWCVVGSNPVKRHYDKFCKRHNGYIHHWHETTKDECGNYIDSYTYEIINGR